MNAKQLIAISAFAILGSNAAFAQEATSDTWMNAESTKSRAQVQAEAARTERVRAEQQKAAEKRAEEPPPQPPQAKPSPPTVPVNPVPTTTGLPSAPVAAPVPTPKAPAPPPPAAAKPEAPPKPSPSEAIAELLDRYKRALESRNIESVKRIWPTLGGQQEAAIRTDFRNTRRITVEIVSPQISVSGNQGTVRFVRRYQLDTVDGQLPRSESRVTMSVQLVGDTWTITQIQYDQIR